MPEIDLVSRLAGGMLGLLVGDAVGVPYEFRPPGTIEEVEFGGHGSHGQPAGTWSDEGAFALADSLLPAIRAKRPSVAGARPVIDLPRRLQLTEDHVSGAASSLLFTVGAEPVSRSGRRR